MTRYCSAVRHAEPETGGRTLLHSCVAPEPVEADVAEAQLLERCRGLRTLADHAAAACAGLRLAARHRAPIVRVLGQLAAAGLMVSEEELVRRARAARRDRPPGIHTVGLVTRDRPGTLSRALESYARNCARFGRGPRFLVMDGSTCAAARARLRRSLADLGRRLDVHIRYVGLEEKRALVDRLHRDTGVAAEVLAFALFDPLRCGEPYGANRNALLLETAGEMFLTADDDTICRGFAVPGARDALAFTAGQPPLDYWFVRDLAAGLDSFAPAEFDLLGCHARLLGRTPASLVGAADAPDLDRLDPAFVTMLMTDRGRVAATLTGMLGDAGGASPIPHLLNARGASRQRLHAHYEMACWSRDYLRAVRAPTLSRGDYFMATSAGLDGRRLLPPFFPVFRCEDNLFGHLLLRSDPDALIGHFPCALVHAPADRRRYARDAVARTARVVPMAGVVAALSAEAVLQERDASGRLAQLAEHFVGVYGPEDLKRALDPFLARTADRVEGILRAHRNAPAAWRADVGRYVAGLRRGPKRYAAFELLDGRDPEQRTCRAIRRYGELLRCWPVIWEAAQSRASPS